MHSDSDTSLVNWQRHNIEDLRKMSFVRSEIKNVTVIAHYFRSPVDFDNDFWRTEFAFLKTFETQGLLPAVLVVNTSTPKIKSFCEKYSIEIQMAEKLIPGRIETLALDLVGNLHKRFETDYVLIVQDDGFPIRPGLSDFVGKYDYIGAPWPGHCHWKDWFPYPKYGVGNGGFCLRSKRICEQAAKAYNAFWRYLPYNWLVGDDVFYCKTMPFFSRYWKQNFCFPDRELAIKFAIEHVVPDLKLQKPPVGFHSETGFCEYVKNFGIPFAEYICTQYR